MSSTRSRFARIAGRSAAWLAGSWVSTAMSVVNRSGTIEKSTAPYMSGMWAFWDSTLSQSLSSASCVIILASSFNLLVIESIYGFGRAVEPQFRGQGHGRLTVARLDLLRRSEEHTSELQSLMRISYAVFCLKKKKKV